MDGPMSGVDPDDVDQEVGNFWRGLYKLEKGFDSVPAAKKIAGKVSELRLFCTVKPVLNSHSKGRPIIVFRTDYCLMQVNSIAECSIGSILQYFRPSFSYHLSVRSLFCLLLSGHERQVLLYLQRTFKLFIQV